MTYFSHKFQERYSFWTSGETIQNCGMEMKCDFYENFKNVIWNFYKNCILGYRSLNFELFFLARSKVMAPSRNWWKIRYKTKLSDTYLYIEIMLLQNCLICILLLLSLGRGLTVHGLIRINSTLNTRYLELLFLFLKIT